MATTERRTNPNSLSLPKSQKVLTEVVKYTPELALGLLESCERNRYLSPITVRRYVAAMERGHWRCDNGEAIKLDPQGNLVDGQHRLQAVVVYGKPVRMLTTFNVHPEAFATIDCGKTRRGADICSILGVRYYATVSAALMLCYRHELGDVTSARVPDNDEYEGLLVRWPEVEDAAGELSALRGRSATSTMFPQSPAVYLYMRFARIDVAQASSFWSGVYIGSDLTKSDPVFKVRDVLLKDLLQQKRMDRTHQMALAIKAWNARRRGVTLRSIRWNRNEAFPTIAQ